MKLVAIPAFTDNCIRMFSAGFSAAVVGPVGSMPDIDMPAPLNSTLAGILVTRHRGNDVGDHRAFDPFWQGSALTANNLARLKKSAS